VVALLVAEFRGRLRADSKGGLMASCGWGFGAN
jgi:hypothetical protein